VTPAWWAMLPPVVVPVPCGEDDHELVWSSGRLDAPAHPNARRERALMALGAEPSACLQLLDAWERHVDDLDVLMLDSRGPADLLPPPGADHPGGGWFAYSPRGRPRPGRAGPAYAGAYTAMASTSAVTASSFSRMRPRPTTMPARYVDHGMGDDLAALLRADAVLARRLSATVVAAWCERTAAGDERVPDAAARLDAALYGRVRGSLLPWLGRPETVAFEMVTDGDGPELRRDADTVRVALPFSWLRDVWAPGFAVVMDRFCLRVERVDDATWSMLTVDRELGPARTLTIALQAG